MFELRAYDATVYSQAQRLLRLHQTLDHQKNGVANDDKSVIGGVRRTSQREVMNRANCDGLMGNPLLCKLNHIQFELCSIINNGLVDENRTERPTGFSLPIFCLLLKNQALTFTNKPAFRDFEQASASPPSGLPSLLEWRSIDVEKPPLINDWLVERLRLNELLAMRQYKLIQLTLHQNILSKLNSILNPTVAPLQRAQCDRSLQFGDTSESFTVCEESGAINRVLIVTGNPSSLGKFERDIKAEKWTVFLPEGSDLIEHLRGDVEVHYLTELNDWNHWMTWDVEYAIRGRTYDIAKLNLYAFQFHSFDQPHVVRRLNMTARHLALTINVESVASSDGIRVLGEWYQLLYWLFFSEGYAVIGAKSSGICGQRNQNCKYQVSLMRLDSNELRSRSMAPVFGLGGYRDLKSEDIPLELYRMPNFHIVTPVKSLEGLGTNVHRVGIGLTHMNETVDGEWELNTLENLLNDIFNNSTVDLLLMDMNGGEVDTYGELLRLANMTRFHQLALRGYVWSEENENFRQIYWNLRQMKNYDYIMRFANLWDTRLVTVVVTVNVLPIGAKMTTAPLSHSLSIAASVVDRWAKSTY
ncbi:unnamed protein product [Angiostrongylus costaricensis]|uniref:Methyltransf_21 domain-containing protein n=1 Tax=Angiostrongylus costaricensis TaxID=334426 RepID=A0A158PEW4_ANGCS|nr:unnamed protein product [Angiostrongylus costaricensis]